jgi:hypothetical protein
MATVPDLRAEVLSALSTAGAYCGECGFQPGETGCPDCVRVRGWYADAVMPIIERLRAELAEEEYVSAERGRYLAQVDAALDAAGQDEGGGYIAYARRITEVAKERDKARAELEQAREARLEWSRTADHPDLVRWAEALVDADLTPHPAFAFRSTTTGYEVAVQVATTDALRDNARAELLAELRKAFDATICQVLGYRPTVARQAADTTSKEA